MFRQVLALAALLTIISCGEPSEKAAVEPATTFRSDADLTPLPLDALLRSVSGAGAQYAELIEEVGPDGPVSGIFAHAPTNLLTAAPTGSRELVVDFGMREASYTAGGNTTGVCFSVTGGPSLDNMGELWRRCLTPVERAEDRGMQEVAVDLPNGTSLLGFNTTAADENTNFGWSYWGNPRVH